MSAETGTRKPVKPKEQVEADFKKLHINGFDQLRKLKETGVRLRGGAAEKDSTDAQASE